MRTILAFLAVATASSLYARVEVYFSPTDRPAEKLIERIDKAKHRIYAAIYMLTEKNIALALARAQQRKVDVRIVFDRISLESPWGKAHIIEESGAKLFLKNPPEPTRRGKVQTPAPPPVQNQPPKEPQNLEALILQPPQGKSKGYRAKPIMHNKFAIIDDVVWTGSFNWTVSANTRNNENVIVLSGEKEALSKFLANFNELVASSTKVDAAIIQAMHRESLSEPAKSGNLQTRGKKRKGLLVTPPGQGLTPGTIDFTQA